jgi:hypothetical protein
MIVGFVALTLGTIGFYAGYFLGLRLAFRKSTPHGLACLLVPLFFFYYLMTDIDRTWKPAIAIVSGLAIGIIGYKLIYAA